MPTSWVKRKFYLVGGYRSGSCGAKPLKTKSSKDNRGMSKPPYPKEKKK